MKTLNALLLLIIIAGFTGCKKESSTTSLIVSVKCENTTLYTFQPLITGASIYLFKDINFALDYVNGVQYDFLEGGILKNKTTGVEFIFIEKTTSNNIGEAIFENLPNGTYAVVTDISKIVKVKRASLDWNGCSIKLPENLPAPYENNKVKFVFDIWPYSVTDLGL